MRRVEEIDNFVPIRHVLISVFDKSGLDFLVAGLLEHCPIVKIYSSGGTFKAISQILGKEKTEKYLMEVSKYTGQPEISGGLVKTLHHKLFLGYLTETYCLDRQNDLGRERAVPIDLAVISLYPFMDIIKIQENDIEDARGNIDVGGPSALRAAAKNWHRVYAMANPTAKEYETFVNNVRVYNGCTLLEDRFRAFRQTFKTLSDYDKLIFRHSQTVNFSDVKKAYPIIHGLNS